MRLSLFILHTPFQLFQAQTILRHRADPEAQSVLFYEGPIPDFAERASWRRIEELPPSDGRYVGAERKRAVDVGWSRIRQTIEAAGRDPVAVFISDIAWPLNNRVFFDAQIARNADFYLIADGLASYTDPRLSLRSQVRDACKWLLGVAGLGSSFRPYWGNALGQGHKRIRGVYAFRSDLLQGTDRPRFEIDFPSPQRASHGEVCLFLDQPYRKFLSETKWRDLRRRTVEELLALRAQTYIYKPHPMCSDDYLESLSGVPFTLLIAHAPIELLLEKVHAGTVVSYTSTALFNISAMCGPQVRCISLFSDYLAQVDGSAPGFAARIHAFFTGAGVELIEWRE